MSTVQIKPTNTVPEQVLRWYFAALDSVDLLSSVWVVKCQLNSVQFMYHSVHHLSWVYLPTLRRNAVNW